MIESHIVYISLGSNKGDRFKNLQDAIDLIYLKIGKVDVISKVYNGPSFGFESEDFLNTCLRLETDLEANEVLKELLHILQLHI